MRSLRQVSLGEDGWVAVGRLPSALLDAVDLEAMWALHPAEYAVIRMHGRDVRTPRWQQAYGTDYRFSGRTNGAVPMPETLQPLHAWAQSVDERLNGLLVNWYDAAHQHYIGKHRDSIANMVLGSPILCISLGATRTFRMRPWRGAGHVDLCADHGAVILIPWDTNRTFTHEVPHFVRNEGRRISITLRAFRDGFSGDVT